jgi:hypothetical protein
MANVLRKLSVEDLNALHLMLWKGAETQLDIARWVEKHGVRLGKSDAAKCMVIGRYAKGEKFQKWAQNFESGNAGLMEKLALQKQRFDMLQTLVQDPAVDGMQKLSQSLQARLLALAAELSDEELVEGAQKNGWIKNLIRVVQEQGKLENSVAGAKAVEICQDKKLSEDEREAKMKEIFGL